MKYDLFTSTLSWNLHWKGKRHLEAFHSNEMQAVKILIAIWVLLPRKLITIDLPVKMKNPSKVHHCHCFASFEFFRHKTMRRINGDCWEILHHVKCGFLSYHCFALSFGQTSIATPSTSAANSSRALHFD